MFDINSEEFENHPLNVFANLYAEDKKNKVYEKCLKDEMKKVTENLINDLTIVEVESLKFLIELNFEMVKQSGVELEEPIKTKMDIMKEIIDNVYAKKQE